MLSSMIFCNARTHTQIHTETLDVTVSGHLGWSQIIFAKTTLDPTVDRKPTQIADEQICLDLVLETL